MASAPDERWSIDELARLAGTNVRNVRFYRERELLPPGQKSGRTMLYGPQHLERVKQVRDLLARGYSLSAIGELLEAWKERDGVEAILGLKAAVHHPAREHHDRDFTARELADLLGGATEAEIKRAITAGLVERHGRRLRSRDPRLLEIVETLVADGVPLRRVLETVGVLNASVRGIARDVVGLFMDEIWEPLSREDEVPPERLAEIAEQIEAYRKRALEILSTMFAAALQQAIDGAAIGRHLPKTGSGARSGKKRPTH